MPKMWNNLKKELWNPESTVPVLLIVVVTFIVWCIGWGLMHQTWFQ